MSKLSSWKTIFFLCVFAAATAIGSPAQTFTTIYTFGYSDGAFPAGPLVQGRDGNLYGTTAHGGGQGFPCPDPYGCGIVFKITPGGTLTTIYSFCSQTDCSDGDSPFAGLLRGTDGNFYGTTGGEESTPDGTVFKITPGGTLTTLHTFDGSDGAQPGMLLVQATDGNFYGTTSAGGMSGNGTVFTITPEGALTTLTIFNGSNSVGLSSLVQATDGNLYGTTSAGGPTGSGTVFKLTPGGTLTTLYSFCPNGLHGRQRSRGTGASHRRKFLWDNVRGRRLRQRHGLHHHLRGRAEHTVQLLRQNGLPGRQRSWGAGASHRRQLLRDNDIWCEQ